MKQKKKGSPSSPPRSVESDGKSGVQLLAEAEALSRAFVDRWMPRQAFHAAVWLEDFRAMLKAFAALPAPMPICESPETTVDPQRLTKLRGTDISNSPKVKDDEEEKNG